MRTIESNYVHNIKIRNYSTRDIYNKSKTLILTSFILTPSLTDSFNVV